MVVQHQVKGYEEFTKLAESLEGSNQTIHVFFTGGKEQQTNASWCTYCVKGNYNFFRDLSQYIKLKQKKTSFISSTAEPIVYDCLKHSNDESFFIHVDVGERDL